MPHHRTTKAAEPYEDPFRRVQDSINVASPGDTVLIMPGIYSGAGNYDLDPNGKRINMGAYGVSAQASKSGNIADLNVDGKVDFIDFAQLAGLWNENTGGIEDPTRDGIVAIGDLDILAENWLWLK